MMKICIVAIIKYDNIFKMIIVILNNCDKIENTPIIGEISDSKCPMSKERMRASWDDSVCLLLVALRCLGCCVYL